MADSDRASAPNEPRRERRMVPRYSIIASAEIVEPVSGVRIAGRISELSRKGCYLDALINLPVGTAVQIRISRDRGTFHSQATIIHVQERMGMGITFLNVPVDQLKLLDSWLAELSG